MAARSQGASLFCGEFRRRYFRVVSAASTRVRASGSCGPCTNQCAWALAKCSWRITESGDWLKASLKNLTDCPKSSRSYASIASLAKSEAESGDCNGPTQLPGGSPAASEQEGKSNPQTRTIHLGLNCIFLMRTSFLFYVVRNLFRTISGSAAVVEVVELAAFLCGVPLPRSSRETFCGPMKTASQIKPR